MTTKHQPKNNHRLAIYYEHPEWFKPLFAELERRGVPYDRLLAHEHRFDPAERESPYALIVNRMSPSAFTRGHTHAIPYTGQYLAYLQAIGANVLNGYESYLHEISKARQLNLFEALGLPYPRSRVINHPVQAVPAAEGLTFPLVVKPNIGGSGAGIQKFETFQALARASQAGLIELGLDHTALVQEYLPARGNSIIRVEILDGEFLYAIRVHLKDGGDFNLCPADYCQPGESNQAGERADGQGEARPLVEGYTPPQGVIAAVKRIVAAAQIEVGGVEYLVNDRDGQIYYYDINALSNFVADAPNVIGFDPFPRLVDFLLARAGLADVASAGREVSV
jgi:glutathione synthase/RimK-type ligase-like ATP-grasp enzyme